ncbi:hypothetical protein PoB_004974300 [Plakobranchus ocellatus]|uniref:Uncharacterized protein n=1 Tax=Plakobranchus ocellatus TaxID=259542 RepID=A0AAV4BVJ2_9GAST|nr:hypothetical protein PoB_004974300 [Plakobranchus ocellatus]
MSLYHSQRHFLSIASIWLPLTLQLHPITQATSSQLTIESLSQGFRIQTSLRIAKWSRLQPQALLLISDQQDEMTPQGSSLDCLPALKKKKSLYATGLFLRRN